MPKLPKFQQTLQQHGLQLYRQVPEVLQINVGKLCNQTCHHCHVDAGPGRREQMELATVLRIFELLANAPEIHTLDITGGAPELNYHFRYLVQRARDLGKVVVDRCNLTVLLIPGQEETIAFLAKHRVKVVASLPCYQADNVDRQRGDGVFAKSIQALRQLNRLGYGQEGSELELDLVYNPSGPELPPAQPALEEIFKQELQKQFGIQFNRLLVITNMPIKRFLDELRRESGEEKYQNLLLENFNPQTVASLMCRQTLSVSWDGQLYDCDFNQMLESPLGKRKTTLWDIDSFADLINDPIALANHCYACTAGAGSSCGGSLL